MQVGCVATDRKKLSDSCVFLAGADEECTEFWKPRFNNHHFIEPCSIKFNDETGKNGANDGANADIF